MPRMVAMIASTTVTAIGWSIPGSALQSGGKNRPNNGTPLWMPMMSVLRWTWQRHAVTPTNSASPMPATTCLLRWVAKRSFHSRSGDSNGKETRFDAAI